MGNLYATIYYSGDVGYDPLYKRYELGKQLLMKVLEDLCRQSVKEVDFGLGDADWKQRFGDQQWQEASTSIFAPTMKGLGINGLRTLSTFVDQAVKRILEKTQILARMKRLWRNRAIKGVQHGSTPD
jgi:CelD/BcsL family acetyltransferase involved in cellulose biosynthesis